MTSPLDLRLLTSFVVVAEELNFTRAAKRLHMTQPPLSLQIKQLEAQLQTLLFERSHQGVRLTAAGEALLVEADKLFAQERRARQLVSRVGRGEEGGQIGIGFTAVASLGFVPGLLRRFDACVPGVFYALKEMNSSAQLSALLRSELDVALVRPPVLDPRLQGQRLFSEPQVLAVPAGHPLAQRSRVRVEHLHGEVLVAYERRAGPYVHALATRWLADHSVVPQRHHEVVHHNALMAVVMAGLGVALIPASAAMRAIDGVVFKRFTGAAAPAIELWIARRKDSSSRLVELCVQEALAHGAAHVAAVAAVAKPR
jgi:DNA-binding transcriptional LysR family regulator